MAILFRSPLKALGNRSYGMGWFGIPFGVGKRRRNSSIDAFGRDSIHETDLGSHLAPTIALSLEQRDSTLDEAEDPGTLEHARRGFTSMNRCAYSRVADDVIDLLTRQVSLLPEEQTV